MAEPDASPRAAGGAPEAGPASDGSGADERLLRAFARCWGESAASAVEAMGGRVHRGTDVVAADLGRPGGFLDAAVVQRPLAAAEVGDALGRIEELIAGSGGDSDMWLFSLWALPAMPAWGWEAGPPAPLMLRPPGDVGRPRQPPELTVRRVAAGAEDDIGAFEDLIAEAYPMPGLVEQPPGSLLAHRLLADGRLRAWLGEVDGRPVTASAAMVDHGVTVVTLVATRPPMRRCGYGQALTWTATLTEPRRPALLVATDAGRPLYETMGYRSLLDIGCWRRER